MYKLTYYQLVKPDGDQADYWGLHTHVALTRRAIDSFITKIKFNPNYYLSSLQVGKGVTYFSMDRCWLEWVGFNSDKFHMTPFIYKDDFPSLEGFRSCLLNGEAEKVNTYINGIRVDSQYGTHTRSGSCTFSYYDAAIKYIKEAQWLKESHYLVLWRECNITPYHVSEHESLESAILFFKKSEQLSNDTCDIYNCRGEKIVENTLDGNLRDAFMPRIPVITSKEFCSTCGDDSKLKLNPDGSWRFWECLCPDCRKKITNY